MSFLTVYSGEFLRIPQNTNVCSNTLQCTPNCGIRVCAHVAIQLPSMVGASIENVCCWVWGECKRLSRADVAVITRLREGKYMSPPPIGCLMGCSASFPVRTCRKIRLPDLLWRGSALGVCGGELQGGFERSLGKCIYAMLKSGGFPSEIGKPWKSNGFQGRGWLVAGKGSASECGSVFEGSSALVNCV